MLGQMKTVAFITKGQKRGELLLYLALWAVLYAAPVLSMLVGDFFTYTRVPSATSPVYASELIDWHGIAKAWWMLTMFGIAFLVHNFLIAPLLVYRGRKCAYGMGTFLLLAAFFCCQLYCIPRRPRPGRDGPRQPREEHPWDRPVPEFRGRGVPPPPMMPKEDGRGKTGARMHEKDPVSVFGGPEAVALVIVSLLLALNVGAKYYFKSRDERRRYEALRHEMLSAQLSYLKYQINPHFFMNTLNNIHALVLIDPEQANRMIETLSKLMRYVLYDGNSPMVPLQKELDFMDNYVKLMRVRYTEQVRISTCFPERCPDVRVPSLLFATFIENAFKHGVSYESDSFIEVRVSVGDDEEVCFECRNSRVPGSDQLQGGIGIANARKRLRLIYGDSYTLRIEPTDKEFRVTLRLPGRKEPRVAIGCDCMLPHSG